MVEPQLKRCSSVEASGANLPDLQITARELDTAEPYNRHLFKVYIIDAALVCAAFTAVCTAVQCFYPHLAGYTTFFMSASLCMALVLVKAVGYYDLENSGHSIGKASLIAAASLLFCNLLVFLAAGSFYAFFLS
jgi:hypothetical protein